MNRQLAHKLVPAVGLGCMGMSEFYGPVNRSSSLRNLEKAYDTGYRHFDTADMYGRGHNESLLGEFISRLGDRRQNLLVASKVGIRRSEAEKYKVQIDGSKAYIKSACDRSLQRLGVERIDLYYLHRQDPRVPIEESVGALAELVQEGKIAAIGLCEVSAETLRKATSVHPISAVQSEYSLWTRTPELDILPECERLGIPFVAYSPLGRGFLAGGVTKKYIEGASAESDFRKILPRFSEENLERNLALVTQLKAISDSLGLRPSQTALSWILSRRQDMHVIPGTKRESFLAENFSSKDISLAPSMVQQLKDVFRSDSVFGERYPVPLSAVPAK